MRLWDLVDGSLLKTLKGHKSEAMRVAWHKLADGTSTAMLASGGTEGEVFIWDVGRSLSSHLLLPLTVVAQRGLATDYSAARQGKPDLRV